jgi:hypothetical protein
MAGSSIPGPVCQVENPVDIDGGTSCLAATPAPGPTCPESSPSGSYSGLWFADVSQPHSQLASFLVFAPPELGALSAKHESNGSPGAIGYDSTGGWSYGTYQLATIPGTFKSFMKFLKTNYPTLDKPLDDAGGADDALDGTEDFRAAWVKVAHDNGLKFTQAQHEFIKATHYDKQVAKLKQNLGLDVNLRSRAVQNMMWSMAVQHGNGTQTIFKNALKNVQIGKVSDAEMIALVYTERSKVDTYFSSSTAGVKASVKKRFQEEQQEALKMLQEENAAAAATGDDANSCRK